jgi:RNA-directed DNA polymerase
MTPPGGDGESRAGGRPSPTANLLERILDPVNVRLAWRRVRTNKGAPGVDGVTVEEFPSLFRPQWPSIRQALAEGRYRPSPVRNVSIPKPTGGTRQLGIPTVLDRLVQQATAQVLTPLIDPTFSDSSHGFRPGRSAHDAVRKVQAYAKAGYTHAVDADLSKCFDRVNHDLLMARLSHHIDDKRVLRLVGRYLRAGAEDDSGTVRPTTVGVPQGGPLSPLLTNVMLDDLDRELERRGHRFARYADDFIILVKSRRSGERVLASITRFLTRKLKLVVNEAKSHVAPVSECSFLGFTIVRGKVRWTDSSFREFKRRLKRYTSRSWGVSMDHRLGCLRRYMRGWMNYYGISEYYRPLPVLDSWLRRRVRMCYWKQWRRCRTRVRHLIRLGAPKRHAIMCGLSRKAYWHLARTLGTQSGMTDSWLAEQGLVSARELWIAVHYPPDERKVGQ